MSDERNLAATKEQRIQAAFDKHPLVRELRGLLAAALCPTCDGRGWYEEPGHACRNEQECIERCPEPVQRQCEWCDRRHAACSGRSDR